MDTAARTRRRLAPRWAARLALAEGTAAAAVLLLFAGLRSVLLLGLGLAGTVVTVVGLWWALSRRGPARALGAVLACAAPLTVVVLYALAGLLWVALVSLALWVLAVSCGRGAMAAADRGQAVGAEHTVAPPRRPFLIMNPSSGGGKVGRFHLVEKATALGAQVAVLDPAHRQDVAALARQAADEGADLLGVAGGDGTQALVAGVAAERGLPFMVVCAGTRNHFALDLGLERADPSRCLDALTDGVELRVDLGRVGDRVFVNNASFGAYAAVVQSPAYRDDKAGTALQLLPDLLTHHTGPRLLVHTPGAADIEAPQAVLVSNNPYLTGDPAGLGRRARLDSGALGVLGIRVDNAAQAAEMIRGGHSRVLVSLTARDVVVDADAPAVAVGVDGEALVLPTPVHCRSEPGALRVRVPRHRPGVPRERPMDWRRVGRLAWTRGRSTPEHHGG
ncbi:diacylglycerol kinase family protein [Streptomyces sp. NPDC051576]|uniref:diacylglycerol/lipid kinase family protein n=1 Tax=Streptomyces sp. NPDC051576 TaxID=3155803 RepID=UPI00343A7F5D